MTVKVVSEGPTVTKKIACPTCTYMLEYSGEDIQYSTDCDGDTNRWIDCPRETCPQERVHVPRWQP